MEQSDTPTTSTNSAPCAVTTTTSNTTTVSSVLSRARAMISHSVSNGAFSRLGRRERLRATSSGLSASSPHRNSPKKQKNEDQKVFEFVVVDVRENDGNSWSFSEDIVLLRGIIELNKSSGEQDVREQIGRAARMKYNILNNEDFEFLRATRRVLTKPVNSGAYDFKQVKLLAGQGSIYLKLKDHIYCLLQEGTDGDEDSKL